MCEQFENAMAQASTNLYKVGDSINMLDIPCRYKGAFMVMADNRGFRFTEDTLSEMETIGKIDSEVLIPLLNGKSSGLGVAYILATYLDNDKARATVLEYLDEERQSTTKENVLKAILSVKK